MSAMAANVFELPTARHMRDRLAKVEAENARLRTGAADGATFDATFTLHLARMVLAVSSTVDGLEEMCNAERDRADEAERLVEMGRQAASISLVAIEERDRRLASVAAEIEGLRAELVEARTDAARAQAAHEAGVALLREMLSRRQAEIEALQAKAAALEKQLSDIQAERITDARRALEIAVKECAKVAASRAEGYGIAEEILSMIERTPPCAS